MEVANTIPYYDTSSSTVVKSFIVQTPCDKVPPTSIMLSKKFVWLYEYQPMSIKLDSFSLASLASLV